MASLNDMLEQLRASRARTLAHLSGIADAQMTTAIPRRQTPADVRFIFYRIVAHEVEHTIHLTKTLQALGVQQTEAQLILRDLQEARGKLEGLIVGLADDDLNRDPGDGQWPLRKVLEHIIETEDSYTGRILEAFQEPATH